MDSDLQTSPGPARATFRPSGLRGLPLRFVVPNIVTLLALCAGLTAIRFAVEARYENAVLAILAAAVLDGVDGRIARALKGSSRFGAELD
jgi:CDP-diacylglycerol--serine O-phosphatidyltransferase